MTTDTRIDAHCHFFNIDFLILELLAMLADDIIHGYPLAPPDGPPVPDFPPDAEAGIGEIIAWFVELVDALFSDCGVHYRFLMDSLRRGFGFAGDAAAYPLMMDIYYMFRGPDGIRSENNPRTFDRKRFEEQCDRVRDIIRKRLDLVATATDHEKSSRIHGHCERIEQRLEMHAKRLSNERTMGGILGFVLGLFARLCRGRIDVSPGFRLHAKELMKLATSLPTNVYPFFAFDPRRRGIMTMIRTGKPFFLFPKPLVTSEGPFYGLKFYTRLGYRPDDESEPSHGTLLEALDFCIEHGFPAVNHSGPGGFPPENIFPNWPWEEYSNPIYWDNVMKNGRRELRINLAHFGYTSDEWRGTIVRMLHEYPNVFTDVACWTDIRVIETVKRLWDDDPVVRDRLMFGTDYDVVLVADIGHDLPEFYARFRSVFSDEDLAKMCIDNPRRFLRIA
jgi:predicted TIM-barrel fold metal-dependent hydrolase